MTTINLKLLYDDDGFCRLCSLHGGDHQNECPGSILHNLRYEVTYDGDYCSRGCCGSTRGANTGETLMEAVTATAKDVIECARYNADARIVFEMGDAHALVRAEAQRVHDEKKAQEAEEEAREELKANTDAFTSAVQALESERGDLTPEAYARRMRELRLKYDAKGVVFSDPVAIVVDDDPCPPRTPEEIESYADDCFRLGNRAVPPWEAREKVWQERHRRT